MTESSLSRQCPAIGQFLARLTDKWSVMILVTLGARSRRFSELKRSLNGVSPRMLTLTLKNLERDGLVKRTVTPSIPPRVDYELTELGQSIRDHVQKLGGWVATNLDSIDAARSQYDHNRAT